MGDGTERGPFCFLILEQMRNRRGMELGDLDIKHVSRCLSLTDGLRLELGEVISQAKKKAERSNL
jgi:hypothetical protein